MVNELLVSVIGWVPDSLCGLVLQLRQSWVDLGYGVLPEASEDRFRSDR